MLDPTSTRHRRIALVTGGTWSVLSLGLLVVASWGVVDCTTHQVAKGITLIALAIVVRQLLQWVVASLDQRASQRALGRLRRDLPQRIGHPVAETERAHGDLLWALEQLSERDSFALLRGGLVGSCLALVMIAGSGGVLSLGIVLGLLALSVPFYIAAGRTAAAAEQAYRTQRETLTQRQLELLAHASELRALGAVAIGARDIGALSEREHHTALIAIRRALRSSLVTEFLGGVSVGLVAMVVGFGLLDGRHKLFGALVAVLATAEWVGWVRRYGQAFHRREAFASAEAIVATTRRLPPVSEADYLLVSADVVTRADPTARSLRARAGDRIAIVGPSGIGKSTLLATWVGWLEPLAGTVRRTKEPVGHVAITSALISGTVRENLLVGASLPDEQLRRALDELGLALSLDTVLSANGEGVSTGERVRLLCARAFLHDVKLLLLDDIGGVLDATSKRLVATALATRTTLCVIEASPDEDLLSSPTTVVVLT